MTRNPFINEDVISLVLMLRDGSAEDVANFVAQSIIDLQCTPGARSATEFAARVERNTKSVQFYWNQVQQINTMNQLYRVLLTTLKELRHQKSSKLEQGSVIDLFTRRTLLSLSRMEFKDILQLWVEFECFKNGTCSLKYDQFQLDLMIKQLSNMLLMHQSQVSFEEINTLLTSIETRDVKVSFLKALNCARAFHPFKAVKQMRRFFDQPQELTDNQRESLSSLQMVAINMVMGFDDECLLNLSEALRLSQTSGDEENINQCLIFLYQIAFRLGHHKEQFVLMEYAINHSLKLANPTHYLQNCLNYWISLRHNRKFKNSSSILAKKHIAWIDALHYQMKKLYVLYDSQHSLKSRDSSMLLCPTLAYQFTLAILRASYGQVHQLKQLLPSSYVNDQIAILQFEAAEWLVDHDPSLALQVMLDVAASMKTIPVEILGSILIVNIKLFNARGDTQAAEYLLEQTELINRLNPSQRSKAFPSPNTKFTMGVAYSLLREISSSDTPGALLKIAELREFAEKEQLPQYGVWATLHESLLIDDRQRARQLIDDVFLGGVSGYSLEIQSKLWYADALLHREDTATYIARLRQSIECASKMCLVQHLKKCYYLLGIAYEMQGGNESERIEKATALREEASLQFCRWESFQRSFKCYTWIRVMTPLQILKLQQQIMLS